MSPESVELIRRWFEGLRSGELQPQLWHEDLVMANWDTSPIPGPYRGHTGLQRWWDDVTDAFEDVRLELKDVIEVDEERMVTTQHVVGRFRLTGIDVDGPFGAIVTVRDGKILSAIGYESPGKAKKAAGLRRPTRGDSGP
jgi:ketosteroid isomerase-like protein